MLCERLALMTDAAEQQSDVLVVFGITGDLARKMTLPALYRLEAANRLDCPVVGVALEDWSVDELRRLLAVHEIGEAVVLRPVAEKVAGEQEADARNAEEREANKVLAELEKLDVTGPEFAAKFAGFQSAVLTHAEHEEAEEFPVVRASCSPPELQEMGRRLLAAESGASTHDRPGAGSSAAQKVIGPFTAMVDKVRDAL